jgi:uncharacterized protein YdeI (YjbR/CyaY-like superfamily)
MGKKDPRVTAYIEKAQPFARPILKKLRALVHETCPKAEETLKWSMPTFLYEGEMLCGMASFKEHATFGFWKGSLVLDDKGRKFEDAMGQFGRLASVADLPAKGVLAGYIRKAMKLNEDGVKVARTSKRVAAKVPADLAAALARNRKAAATFAAFPPSARYEYIEWITEAKQEATRARRLSTTIEWLAEGKRRHWKYENC